MTIVAYTMTTGAQWRCRQFIPLEVWICVEESIFVLFKMKKNKTRKLGEFAEKIIKCKYYFFCQIGVTALFVVIQIGPPIAQDFRDSSIRFKRKRKIYIKNKSKSKSCKPVKSLTDFPNLDTVHAQWLDVACKKLKTHSSDDGHDDLALVFLHRFWCTQLFAVDRRHF